MEGFNFRLLLIIISISILPFSPLLTLVFSIIGCFFSKRNIEIVLFSIPIIISFALIATSRDYFIVKRDDFQTYYDVYRNLDGNFFFFYNEFGINILNYFIFLIFGDLTPRGLSFIYLIVSSSILFLSVYRIFDVYFNSTVQNKAKVLALVMIFSPFFAPTIFVRQYFSLVILLLSLTFTSKYKRYFGYFISFIFHTTSIPILLLIKQINNRALISKFFWFYLIIFTLLSCAILFNVEYLLVGAPKIRAWFVGDNKFEFLVFIKSYFYIITVIIFSLVFLSFSRKENQLFIRMMVLCLCIAFILDFNIPYISTRFFLLFFILVGGFYSYISLMSRYTSVLFFIFLLLGITKQLYLISPYEINYATVYQSYSFFNTEPFYYIHSIMNDIHVRTRDFY